MFDPFFLVRQLFDHQFLPFHPNNTLHAAIHPFGWSLMGNWLPLEI
jgi:hypothetical protein